MDDPKRQKTPITHRVPPLKPRVAYDREAAYDYAKKHWNIICSDEYIAGEFGDKAFIKVPQGTKFEHEFTNGKSLSREHAIKPNGEFIKWKNLDDCTHFISCCIGRPPSDKAGGLPLKNQLGIPPNAPYGIVRVSTMVDFLNTKKFVRAEGEKTTDKDRIKRLEKGDLIAYFNTNKGRYTHLAMYIGNGKIGCHTYCRFDDPNCTWDNDWDLGEGQGFSWTFLHFIV
jgi:hypothetical protein